jgi:hypothetical protein
VKITEYISKTINRLPKGYVFTYDDFIGEVKKKEAIIKALNRMAAAGKITKLSKGKYYKAKDTAFGKLAPDQYQMVKDFLEDENAKPIGYLTGYSIFNELGLTSQLSNTIQIGRNNPRPQLKRDRYTIKFVQQKNNITKDNIYLLQLLDSIRFIKKILDTTIPTAVKRLRQLINGLEEKDIATLIRLSMQYPPSTRALLGAILEDLKKYEYLQTIEKSLNPITQYDFPKADQVLDNTTKWNIEC